MNKGRVETQPVLKIQYPKKNLSKYKNKYHAILNCDYPVNSLVAWFFCVQRWQPGSRPTDRFGYSDHLQIMGKQTFLTLKFNIMAIGIENLKLVAKTGVDLGQKLAETFEDGKITLPEGFNLLSGLMGIPDILKKKAEIKAEWKDLDTAERTEIKAYVAAELTIPNNPALERKIEKGFDLIFDILDFIGEFKKAA